MSIVLLSTTESLQVVLDAAPATNQLPCVPSWADIGGSAGGVPVPTNGTTAVTVVPAPASSVARVINSLSIPNRDTATRIVTVNKVVSAVSYQIIKVSLPTGFQLYYQNNGGWRVLDASGNFIESVQANQVGTWTVNVSQFGGTNVTLGQKVSASSMPVVISSDQSTVSVAPTTGSAGLTARAFSTAAQTFGTSATKFVNQFQIDFTSVTTAGLVSLRIQDGSGNVLWSYGLPTLTTSFTMFGAFRLVDLALPLVNAGSAPSIVSTANVTAGQIAITIGFT